jgi:hypothetical protein
VQRGSQRQAQAAWRACTDQGCRPTTSPSCTSTLPLLLQHHAHSSVPAGTDVAVRGCGGRCFCSKSRCSRLLIDDTAHSNCTLTSHRRHQHPQCSAWLPFVSLSAPAGHAWRRTVPSRVVICCYSVTPAHARTADPDHGSTAASYLDYTRICSVLGCSRPCSFCSEDTAFLSEAMNVTGNGCAQ